MDELLTTLEKKMEERFPGFQFEGRYSDHAVTSATWTFPMQKDDLLGAYAKTLTLQGKTSMANRLVPGIRFMTSDTGLSSAKVSAMLMGTQHPIHIGSCVAVDHRHQKKVSDFGDSLDQLFAQFCDSVAKLQNLLEIHLDYPVNTMTRICKKLSLPKKEAVEAIAMYEMAYGGSPATAHDIFMAMQEIPYLLKTHHAPEAKMLAVFDTLPAQNGNFRRCYECSPSGTGESTEPKQARSGLWTDSVSAGRQGYADQKLRAGQQRRCGLYHRHNRFR